MCAPTLTNNVPRSPSTPRRKLSPLSCARARRRGRRERAPRARTLCDGLDRAVCLPSSSLSSPNPLAEAFYGLCYHHPSSGRPSSTCPTSLHPPVRAAAPAPRLPAQTSLASRDRGLAAWGFLRRPPDPKSTPSAAFLVFTRARARSLHAWPQTRRQCNSTPSQARHPARGSGGTTFTQHRRRGDIQEGLERLRRPVHPYFFYFPFPFSSCLSAAVRRTRCGGATVFTFKDILYALIHCLVQLFACWASRSVRANQHSRVWRIIASRDFERVSR